MSRNRVCAGWWKCACIAWAAVGALVAGCPGGGPPQPNGTVQEFEAAAWNAVNAERAAEGLAALPMDANVRAVARAHSEDMAARNFFDHYNPEGENHADRLSAAGISAPASGENISYTMGYENPVPVVVDGWMNSPGHRSNILDAGGTIAWTHTGMGVAIEGNEAFFTQVFVRYSKEAGAENPIVVFGSTGEIVELPPAPSP